MKDNHRCIRCSPSIGVVIPARNEEDHILRTLQSVMGQTRQPRQVVVVNDRSTDGTARIAGGFDGVTVADFPYDHPNWVILKELALVFNQGLAMMDESLDYVTIVGSDEILPPNHFDLITSRMGADPDVTIASGHIRGESNTVPRGSGRIVDWQWWRGINGGLYPVNYGYESWLLAKCVSMGKKFAVYPEIESTVQRATGAQYADEKYYHRGQAYAALGYNRRFVLGRAIILAVRQRKPLAARRMLQGFMFAPITPYDDAVRKYYRDLQNSQMSVRNIPWMISRFRDSVL